MVVHGQRSEDIHKPKPGDRFRRLATRWTGDDVRYLLREGEARDVVPSRFYPCDLEAGDKMQCDRFPLIWKHRTGLEAHT